MMYTHFVALFATAEVQIAYHSASRDIKKLDENKRNCIRKLNGAPINIPYNTHYIHGEISPEDDALKSYDPYFEKYTFVDLESFYKSALENSELNSVDVAAYLKRKYNLLNAFELQKNLYYIYADYLVSNGKPPFKARFVAYDRGPVDQKVYADNKYNKEKLVNNFNFEQKAFNLTKSKEFLKFIDSEVNKYKFKFKFEMSDNPTHRENTPWSIAMEMNKDVINPEITDRNILQNHKNELIE